MGKIGSVVALETSPGHVKSPVILDLGQQLAMHVAGFSPEFIKPEEVTPEVMEKHKKHFEQVEAGTIQPFKRVQLIRDSIEDKDKDDTTPKRQFNPNKVIEQLVLMEQWTIDGSKKVKDLVAETSKKLGAPIEVKSFIRLARGEGIEKKEQDFAQEVSELLKKQ